MKHERRLVFLLAAARQRVMNRLNHELVAAAGVTAPQAAALFFIQQHEGCSLTELSRGLLLDNSAITGLVGRLEKRGFVVRQGRKKDRRAAAVALTRTGRDAAAAALPVVKATNAAIQTGFSKQEIDAFGRVLEQTIARFSEPPEPSM